MLGSLAGEREWEMNTGWDSQWKGEHVEGGATQDVDDLFDSLGLNADPNARLDPTEAEETPSRASRLATPLAAALGVALLLAAGAMIWLVGLDSESTQAGGETITTDALAPANLDVEADKLMGVLSGLSLDRVAVEVRDDKIYLTGSVPDDQALGAVRNAVIAASDPALINMTEIVVGGPAYADQLAAPVPAAPGAGPGPGPGSGPGQDGQPPQGPPPPPPPGAPPPGFVPPSPEQRANLQVELDRVLTDTPLVFDPGSTDLSELQLRVLESTVIGLLESHPGVPVRLVGYTDEQGDEFTNSLLSFDRAEAVRDYLISRGVPEFILRVEGRGEDDASGDSGADRRVEIEVIDGP